MFWRLLILFTVIPFAELVLLVWLSEATSIWFTLAVVFLTGILGAALAKRQGWRVWRRIQEELSRAQPPADALLDAVMILVAGILLITPGILTDLTGFALLVPAVRNVLKRRLIRFLKNRAMLRFQSFHRAGFRDVHREQDDTIIDVEFTRHPVDRDKLEEP